MLESAKSNSVLRSVFCVCCLPLFPHLPSLAVLMEITKEKETLNHNKKIKQLQYSVRKAMEVKNMF